MNWFNLLRQSPAYPTDLKLRGWFDRIADQLLRRTRLVVNRQPHRLVEIELYYYDELHHPDPFAHRQPMQLECGRWYFHRTGDTHRNGSYKGIDVSFGPEQVYAGILIRGLETPDGDLVDGPSLCVDHLLKCTGADDVAALDRAINRRLVWQSTSPLQLGAISGDERAIYQTARVGLTLKRFKRPSDASRFVLQPYRYLTEPRRTKKGRLHLILALHAHGKSADEIRAVTGSPKATIERYVANFEAGRQKAEFDSFHGVDPNPRDLCRMHGAWRRIHVQREPQT